MTDIRDFFPVFDYCGFMTGDVALFPMENAPTGFLECNGTLLSRTTYSGLFKMIGTTYGYTTSTNFRIPDYRGFFLRGMDAGSGRDPQASIRLAQNGSVGDYIGSEQGDLLISHSHVVGLGTGAAQIASGLDDGENRYGGEYYTDYYGGIETRPTNIYVLFCIKY